MLKIIKQTLNLTTVHFDPVLLILRFHLAILSLSLVAWVTHCNALINFEQSDRTIVSPFVHHYQILVLIIPYNCVQLELAIMEILEDS